MILFFNQCARFWRTHPALLYSLIGIGSFYFAISKNLVIAFLFGTISIPLLFSTQENGQLRLALAISFAFSIYWMGTSLYRLPEIDHGGIHGAAKISIQQISAKKTHFGEQYLYRGKLISFNILDEDGLTTSFGEVIKNGNFTITITQKKGSERPLANRTYLIFASVKSSSQGNYILIPKKGSHWQDISKSFSFAEKRLQMKEFIKGFLENKIKDKQSFLFLSGILTGIFDDRTMTSEFGRFGLQHIMAISGFHFSMLSLFLSFLLHLIFKPKNALLFILMFLTIYFLFLGCSPSVLRAWIASFLFFFGLLIGKTAIPLNSLGCALMLILFIDPLLCLNLGFQLSFLATASILFFYRPIEELFSYWTNKRSLEDVRKMPVISQHAFLILTMLKQSLSLCVSVNLATLPLILLYFHKFPILSILFNCFFPLLVAGLMFFLLLCFCTFWLPPLNELLFSLLSSMTNWTLGLVYNLPTTLDFWIRIRWISSEMILLYLSLLLLLGIFVKSSHQEEMSDSSFGWI